MTVTSEFRDILDYPYWHHRIRLNADGSEFTPGIKTSKAWGELGLPEDMSGKSFLDIGAWDGLHSFEAERRGASRVVATDVYDNANIDSEHWSQVHSHQRGIELVKEYTESNIQINNIDLYELNPDDIGSFDIVLCSGVLYHLPEPYRAMEKLIDMAQEKIVVETVQNNLLFPIAAMQFTKQDPTHRTNWWSPSAKALSAMTEVAGGSVTNMHVPGSGTSEVPPVSYALTTDETPVYQTLNSDNTVDTIDHGELVKVLYSDDNSPRVRINKDRMQGWIPKHALKSISEKQRKFRLLRRNLRSQGFKKTLTRAAIRALPGFHPRIVLHATVDK